MAVIKPFNALRFTADAGSIDALTCPPYDIISEEERKAYLKTNEHNVIRLELPREGEDPYKTAGEVLESFLQKGIVACDEKPAVYIYEESFSVKGKSYSVKGFICRVKLEDFSAGVVLPHEETLSKAKRDRFDLMCATGCNFSQIYSLYNDGNGCEDIINRLSDRQADITMTDSDNVTHRLWIAQDGEEVAALCEKFADKKLYIADGHHRYETALNYRNHLAEQGVECEDSKYVMMCLVAMENDGLVVFPTHRIVRGLDGFDKEKTLAKCRDYFDLKAFEDSDEAVSALEKAYDENKKAFLLYKNDYTLLTLRDEGVMDSLLSGSDALKHLDVSVLHSLVLERLFGIDKVNMANQTNLTYTRDTDEAVSAVDSGDADCAFILNPTRVQEIRDVAAAGDKMPQKSTYFYPKLITGLVMNKIR